MRRLANIAFLVVASFAAAILASTAHAQKRIALVVGIDKYDNLGNDKQLQRAVNDAKSVGAALKALGFEVITGENLPRSAFNEHLQRFFDKLAPGDIAAFYYAGHGVEIEGLNFLLPRDVPNVKYGRQEQIKRESLSFAEILLDLRSRSPEIGLIILDACRDNPFVPEEQRSAGSRGGLAPLRGEPPRGTFIMYSAGAGETALDRLPGNDPDRVNSVFARKLLPLLGRRGLALHDLARQLRADVFELVSTVPHTQRPAYYDGVIGRYCPAGCESTTVASKPGDPSISSQRLSEAAEAWGVAKDTTNVAVLEAFIARYGETFYADLAKMRIGEVRKQQAAAEVARKKTEDDARATADTERQRVAMLQQDGERKSAEAAAQRTKTGATTWSLLGEKEVGFGVDRDVIRIGQSEDWYRNRSFRTLHFIAEGNDMHMMSIRLVYFNNFAEDFRVDQLIRQGNDLPIDLRGERSFISRIEMVYRSRPNFRGQAVIKVYGEPARFGPGPGPSRPGPSAGRDWEELGCKQVSLFGKDRDSINAGRREGRFKAIRLHVRGADVEMLNLRVIYSNGEPDNLEVRHLIRQGERTMPLDLRGWERSIDRVDMVYRTVPNFKGLATVCVEGLQ